MTGQELLRELRNSLNEDDSGVWLDDFTSYNYLYQGATEWVERTHTRTKTARIHTRSDVATYDLPADFIKIYQLTKDKDWFLYYQSNDQGGETELPWKDWQQIERENYTKVYLTRTRNGTLTTNSTADKFSDTKQDFSDYETTTGSSDGAAYMIWLWGRYGDFGWGYIGDADSSGGTNDRVALYQDKFLDTAGINGNSGGILSGATIDDYMVVNTSSVTVPSSFSIKIKESVEDPIEVTCASTGAEYRGESWLVETGNNLRTLDVAPGDYLYNITDTSEGRILEVTGDYRAKVALFGGTNNYCSSDDDIVIVKQQRMQVALDPPPSASSDMVLVPYLARPNPVFSDHRSYGVRPNAGSAIAKYAAFLYKFRDSEPDFASAWFMAFDREVRKELNQTQPYLSDKRQMKVNLMARAR